MFWENRDESSNVEDRRAWGRGGLAVGGGGGLIILLIAYFLGINPNQITLPDQNPRNQNPVSQDSSSSSEDRAAKFSKVILHDTEQIWTEQFRRLGRQYRMPTMVLFRGGTQSGCGFAQSAVGPFYCPRDARVYLDLGFFDDLSRKLNAPGEFARAYVIAHEVGHHVQKQLGYMQRFERNSGGASRNQASVHFELQADFLAGVWAFYGQKEFSFMEAGDLESALNAASQIGDDRLQSRSQGHVVPDSFTHGTSAQRVAAFSRGFRTGDLRQAESYFSDEGQSAAAE